MAPPRQAASSPDSALLGREVPRLWTPPKRELTRETTRGYEVVDFADQVLGMPLLPWQRWLFIHALELEPDGSYRFRVVLVLVARQNGKTEVLVVRSLWGLFLDGVRLVLGAAQDLDIAREAWSKAVEYVEAIPELADEKDLVRRTNGDEYLRLIGGARYKIKAANRSAGRGPSVDLLNLDELREQRNWEAWGALSKTTMARPFAQTWAFSNAGDEESVVLNHLREAALSGRDPTIGLFEWSGPDGCELDDWDAIAQANPGLGHIITPQAIRSAQATDPPDVYRTEVLCQKVDRLNSAVDMGAWRACKDNHLTLDNLRDRVAWCIDVAPDGNHVALAAAAVGDDERVRVEIVESWESPDQAREQLQAWVDANEPCQISWFPGGPAGVLGADIRQLVAPKAVADRYAHDKKWRFVREIKGAEQLETCQEFADLTDARRLLHPDDPLLNAHVAAAQRKLQGDGWRFVRRGVGHVNAAYAAAGAVRVARTLPEQARPKPRSAVY